MTADADPRDRFERIWDDCYEHVLAYLARRAPGDAGDLAAETFAVAWRRIGDVPREPLPWLYGVARRVLANRRRGDRRAGALVARLGGERPGSAPDPADLVGSDEALRAGFAALSDADREILALVAWEGLRPGEAAAVLGIPAPLASARLHRARARLRRALAAADAPPTPTTTPGEQR
ncbi:MAG: RNA polymerase sigma factor [Thermoleophilia bacterium]